MNLVHSISQRAQDIPKLTSREAPDALLLLEGSLELYARAFALARTSDQPDQAMARMSLASHSFSTLCLAARAAGMGFYLQSISMLRSVYENWLSLCYLEKFPSDAHLWLEARPDRRPPKAETMRNEIDAPSKGTKNGLHKMYEVLNRFVHTDPIVVLSHYREVAGQPHVFVGIEFDKEFYLSCVYGLVLWTGLMLEAVSGWIAQDDEWHKDVDQAAQQILEYLEWYNGRPEPGAA